MNFVKLATSMIGVAAERLQSHWPHRKWQIWYHSLSVITVTLGAVIILIRGVLTGGLENFEIFGITDVIPQYLGFAGTDGTAVSQAASTVDELWVLTGDCNAIHAQR